MSDWSALGLPCPRLSGYRYDYNPGLLRTGVDTAQPRQAIGWKTPLRTFSLSAVVTAEQLAAVEAFFAADAYDWFTVALVSGAGDGTDHTVRAVGDYTISPLGTRYVITFPAETRITAAAADTEGHGYSTTDVDCCEAEDTSCCGCVYGFEEAFGADDGITATYQDTLVGYVPSSGDAIAVFRDVFSSTAAQLTVGTSSDGTTWTFSDTIFSTVTRIGYGAAQVVGDYLFVPAAVGVSDWYLLVTADGETWHEKLLQTGTPRVHIKRVFQVGSTYWAAGNTINRTGGDILVTWTATDPTDTWTRVDQSSMSFAADAQALQDDMDDADWLYSSRLGKFFCLAEGSSQSIALTEPPWPTGQTLEEYCLYSSSNGLDWTRVTLADGYRFSGARLIETGSEVLLIPTVTAASGATSDRAPWVFASSDGLTFSKKSQLPEHPQFQFDCLYYTQSGNHLQPIYVASESTVVVFNSADYYIGYALVSRDNGASWQALYLPWFRAWYEDDEITEAEAALDCNYCASPDGAAWIPSLGKLLFARRTGSGNTASAALLLGCV